MLVYSLVVVTGVLTAEAGDAEVGDEVGDAEVCEVVEAVVISQVVNAAHRLFLGHF